MFRVAAVAQDRSGARSAIEGVGGDFDKVYNGGCLSKQQCQELLAPDVQSAQSSAQGIFGSQCSCISAVLTDMTYNLVRQRGAGARLRWRPRARPFYPHPVAGSGRHEHVHHVQAVH